MKKWFLRLSALLLVIGLITGCGEEKSSPKDNATTNNSSETTQEKNSTVDEQKETVVITLSKDDGEEIIEEKEIPIEENAILMDVMEENFDIETEYDGEFISSIDGIAPGKDEQKAWMFFVNDEMPTVGAKEVELSPGDKITFDLQAWE